MINNYKDLDLSKDGTPKWDSLLGVILGVLRDKKKRDISAITEEVIAQLQIPEEMQNRKYVSGVNVIENKVRFALSALKRGGLLKSPERGNYEITEKGIDAYKEKGDDISKDSLSFSSDSTASENIEDTSEESSDLKLNISDISDWVEQHEDAVHDELLHKLLPGGGDDTQKPRAKSNAFEYIVAKLMEKMGLQGEKGKVRVTKQSGDGGVDIEITRDSLGMQKIYVQAKDYDPQKSPIGRNTMSDFVTVITDGHAQGIFVTTASYSKDARKIAKRHNIVLIDGDKLLDLMIEHGVGVKETGSFTLHKVDDMFLKQTFEEANGDSNDDQ